MWPLSSGGVYSHTFTKWQRVPQMPTAYAYLRYSTKAQGEADKDSIDRQMSSISALTAQYNIELLPENIFRDDGVSSFDGSNKKTGRLKDLIDLILSQKIKAGDFVFVESIDRLSRQKFRLSKELVYSILDKGVILITTIDSKKYFKSDDETKNFEQDLYLSLIATRAHEESKTKSIRRKSAWNKAKENAEKENKIFNGHNPPYGINFDKENNCFVINEEEAEEIRFIFKSLESVGVTKTIQKVNVFSKKKWTNKTISLLLETKYPIGYYRAQKRDENKRKVFERFIENYYPPIISFEDFNTAVSSMKLRAHRKHYGNQSISSLNIFRHSLICDACKASMFFESNKNQKGVKYAYLHCSRKRETKVDCNAQRLRFEHVLGLLFEFIEIAFQDYELIKNYTDEELQEIEKEALKKGVENLEQFQQGVLLSKEIVNLIVGKEKESESGKEIEKVNNLLIKEKMTLENLNNSIKDFNGKIPASIFNALLEHESNIEKYEIELNTLRNFQEESASLKIANAVEFFELVKTEAGRLEINNFFVKNNIAFSAGYQEEENKIYFCVYKNSNMLFWNMKKFDLHKPLEKYGFDKIHDYA
ncbi:MAG: hypothetical protein C0439_04240 [Pseudomonas sp.]|nr:hypothetical protein [Pseudomonas sp.]